MLKLFLKVEYKMNKNHFYLAIVYIVILFSSCSSHDVKSTKIVDVSQKDIDSNSIQNIELNQQEVKDTTNKSIVEVNPIKKEEDRKTHTKKDKDTINTKKTIVFLSNIIEDFSKWEAAFIENSDSSSIFSYLLDVDSTSKIGVWQFTKGLTSFKKQLVSPLYKDFMNRAGIKTTQISLFLNIVWVNPTPVKKKYHIIISHKVLDFVKWKIDFDSNRENRELIGISDVLLAVGEKTNNEITMILATDNIDMCRSLFTNPDVVEVLKKAGVVGELNISYWKVMSNK